MPTTTEYFGYGFSNLGPLTTTYTAPSSCSTNTDRVFFANESDIQVVLGYPSCDWGLKDECYPSGSDWETLANATSVPPHGLYVYFSPGVACPAGWETAGTLAHASETSEIAMGALSETPDWRATYTGGGPTIVRATDMWLGILDTSETLALCCPSGYTGNSYGGCVSSLGPLSSYTYSQLCFITTAPDDYTVVSTVAGSPVTEGVISRLSRATATETNYEDLNMTEPRMSGLAVATYVPGVHLVYKQSDVEDAKKNSTDDDEKDSDGQGEDNAASMPSSRQGVVSVLAVTIGLLAGAGMILPW
ncbi:hypothetical protein NM208_g480 [Fusarium decemcellulare]|uniref:Uncharacterized protein n=1 Tax=Fusarium decemcellulare TaxID=57161 RepID=A0ACC1SZN7_9HYPO|nr:hypothetical protein NM208_g480 [Fusarium decemcellulare]